LVRHGQWQSIESLHPLQRSSAMGEGAKRIKATRGLDRLAKGESMQEQKRVVGSILGDSKPEDCVAIEGYENVNGECVKIETILDMVKGEEIGTFYYGPRLTNPEAFEDLH
jgi:hypothetical protein